MFLSVTESGRDILIAASIATTTQTTPYKVLAGDIVRRWTSMLRSRVELGPMRVGH